MNLDSGNMLDNKGGGTREVGAFARDGTTLLSHLQILASTDVSSQLISTFEIRGAS